MDRELLGKSLDFLKKKKKWVLLCALLGASGYGAFRVYQLPGVKRKRKKLLNLVTVFFSMAELVSDSAETIGVVSSDIKEFLKSDSDEIPKSLKQISKIATSDEFSDSLTRVSEALTVGILRAYGSEMRSEEGGVGGSVSDKVMDRMFSSAGTGFVSVVAGSFARNLVLGLYSNGESVNSSNGNVMANGMNDEVDLSSVPRWVNVICADKCKDFMANCIQVFVSTAVAVYLDKTLDINAFDEIFAGLTNPSHESKMKDILVSVCNGAVETFVKTSHHVLTSKNTNSNSQSSLSSASADHSNYTSLSGHEFSSNDKKEAIPSRLTDTQVSNDNQGGSWSSMVLSELSVPRNRRLVLDVTGRVTFETLKSVVEFLQWKVTEGLKRSSYAVHDHVVHRGRQAVKYFSLRSYVSVIVCFALLLHLICRTRALLPA